MMPSLIFASHNTHKTKEIGQMLGGDIEILSLTDIGLLEEIPEDGQTLQENAWIKANEIYQITGKDCFADDTGLMVDALDGRPGVYSARYAGPEKDSKKNNQKLLAELAGQENRKAKFVTQICLILDGQAHYFEGVLTGSISHEEDGSEGFGYDPVFIPTGSEKTLANFSLEQKNQISHRANAFNQMKAFLKANLK